jgi:hypothetical protein
VRCLTDLVRRLRSSRPFPCCLIHIIEQATFTADSSFNIRRLIAANSSFRVGLPSSRCERSRSPSPPLATLDAVRYRSVWFYPNELRRRTGPRRCPRGVSRPLRRRRGSRRFPRFRSLGLGEADGAQCARQDRSRTPLLVMRDSAVQWSRWWFVAE